MVMPGYSHDFEDELGVDKSKGMDSYDYMVTYEAMTIDSRFMWRAQTKGGGYYRKTFDMFMQGSSNIDKEYRSGNVTYPFWAHPIPKFVSNQGGTKPEDLSYVESAQGTSGISAAGRLEPASCGRLYPDRSRSEARTICRG